MISGLSFFEIDQYPRAILEKDFQGDDALYFKEPGLESCSLPLEDPIPGESSLFTVQWMNGPEKELRRVVWMNHNRLRQCFGVNFSDQLLKVAALNDDLARLVIARMVLSDLPRATTVAKQLMRSLHFSAKHYGLQHSMYITKRLVACGLKSGTIFGGSARVKLARTLKGEILVRRICDISHLEYYKQAQTMIAALNKFRRNPAVIDLRGVCEYTKLNGRTMVVTFHSYYPKDLFGILFKDWAELSETEQLNLADQLFTALQSLDGAHGDLKPENILFTADQKRLVLADFEFYRSNEERGKHVGGTREWCAPECFSHRDILPNKLDVWPAGLILYYLFLNPSSRKSTIAWQKKENEPNMLSSMNSEVIKGFLDKAPLSMKKRILLSHMIEIDLEKRWTIDQAAYYFRENILLYREFSSRAPMDVLSNSWLEQMDIERQCTLL